MKESPALLVRRLATSWQAEARNRGLPPERIAAANARPLIIEHWRKQPASCAGTLSRVTGFFDRFLSRECFAI